MKSQNKDIVALCLKGDRKAQYQLYQDYSKAMYNICLRMMNDPWEAEDVLQVSFVDVFTKIHMFKGTSTIGAWIKRICINNCINQLRKRKMMFSDLEGNLSNLPEENEVSEVSAFEVESVKKCIQKLPEGFRIVLSLYLLEGYDHKEIAGILEISESTSKSQYHRAKIRLKQMLRA